MSLSTFRQDVQALLESADGVVGGDVLVNDDGEDTNYGQQGQLCRQVLLGLERLQNQQEASDSEDEEPDESPLSVADFSSSTGSSSLSKVTTAGLTVRSVLGPGDVSPHVHVLAGLLVHRVDPQRLLPLTYDTQGNQDALLHRAMTLTRASLQAAELYAALMALPGAWGCGLVELQALSALTALVRRWSVECCGREEEAALLMNDKETAEKKKGKKAKSRAVSKRHHEDDLLEEEGVQPVKRSRPSRRAARGNAEDSSDSSDDEDSSEDDDDGGLVILGHEYNETSQQLQPHELWTLGLQVAKHLCRIPLQREFLSWSGEARDAMLDAVACILGTSAALAKGAGRSRLGGGGGSSLASEVVEQASEALEQCLMEPNNDDSSDASTDTDSADWTARHETAVSILRGLYSLLTTQEELPNGQAGKQAAAAAASEVLERLMEGIANDLETNPHRWPRSMTTTRRLSVHPAGRDSLLVTPLRPRQSSGDGTNGETPSSSGNRSLTPKLTPAKLKTPATSSTPAAVPATRTARLRPVVTALMGMLQKLVTCKGLEKAAARARTVDTLHKCLRHLPVQERFHFLTFLLRLCHSKLSVHRLVGVELVGRILTEEWLWSQELERDSTPASTDSEPPSAAFRRKSLSPLVQKSSNDMPAALFGALQGRMVDRLPAIRAASAVVLEDLFGQLLESKHRDSPGGPVKLSTMGLMDAIQEEADALVEGLRQRASSDDKATVRKAAVGALAELLLICESTDHASVYITEGDVAILCELCQDSSMLTRKASAEALTLLLEQYGASSDHSNARLAMLEQSWCSSVLTLVLDSENSCITKAASLADRVVFAPVLESSDEGDQVSFQTAWNVLAAVGGGSGKLGTPRSETEALRVAVAKRVEQADSPKVFLKALLNSIHDAAMHTVENQSGDPFEKAVNAPRAGAWTLLNAVMGHSKDLAATSRIVNRSKIDLDFIGEAWKNMLDVFLSPGLPSTLSPSLRGMMRNCLEVMSKLAAGADASVARGTAKNLQELVSSFKLPPEIIGAAITALTAMTVSANPNGDMQRECGTWIRAIFKSCEEVMAPLVSSGHMDSVDSTTVDRALFTVGELSLVGFQADDDGKSGPAGVTKDSTRITDSVRGLCVRPSSHLVNLVQVFLPRSLPGPDTSPTPARVRAHAFTTLGKLCLRDEKLAKQSLNVFARELSDNMSDGSSSVQSNVLLVLGDLCVRYTNLVDRYLPVMAACLQSGITDLSDNVLDVPSTADASLVRKHAVLLLSSLLLQDYVKWRGLLFHRFLVASADEDEDVSRLAEMVLCGPLITKQPKLFFNQFVESLFVLNRCTAHSVYQAAAAIGDAGSGVSVGFDGIRLTGEAGRVRRFKMYEMMLSKMSDEEKIGVTARITKEVLGSALQRGTDLNRVCTTSADDSSLEDGPTEEYESALNVLSDAFAILSSPLIRVGGKAAYEADDLDDPNAVPDLSKRVIVARGQLLSNISRKHLIETILPVLCGLKAVLQKSRSKLLKELMSYLVDVFRLYKTEVKEFLANDLSLLQEIEYDCKRAMAKQRQLAKEQGEADGTENSTTGTQEDE